MKHPAGVDGEATRPVLVAQRFDRAHAEDTRRIHEDMDGAELPLDPFHSFVDGLPRDGEDLAIVRAVMGLASSLHLEVTAEGVERTEQARCLLDAGCRRGQGYLYSPPVPAVEFLAVSRRLEAADDTVAAGSERSGGDW